MCNASLAVYILLLQLADRKDGVSIVLACGPGDGFMRELTWKGDADAGINTIGASGLGLGTSAAALAAAGGTEPADRTSTVRYNNRKPIKHSPTHAMQGCKPGTGNYSKNANASQDYELVIPTVARMWATAIATMHTRTAERAGWCVNRFVP